MVSTGHVKAKGVGKLDSCAGIAAQELTSTPAVIFSYPCGSRWFIFTKQICINLSHYLQLLAGVLQKTYYTIYRKTTVSESFFNQSVACYFFNKRLQHRHFLVDITKLSRTQFLQEHLETTDSVFMEHICNYNIIKFNVN